MQISRQKVRVFFHMYQSGGWFVSNEFRKYDMDIRTIRKNLMELADDKLLIRVKSHPAFKYKVDMSHPGIKRMVDHCEMYGLTTEKILSKEST